MVGVLSSFRTKRYIYLQLRIEGVGGCWDQLFLGMLKRKRYVFVVLLIQRYRVAGDSQVGGDVAALEKLADAILRICLCFIWGHPCCLCCLFPSKYLVSFVERTQIYTLTLALGTHLPKPKRNNAHLSLSRLALFQLGPAAWADPVPILLLLLGLSSSSSEPDAAPLSSDDLMT